VSELWLDFETKSMVDLKKRGLDVYSSDPSTEVLMCAYALDQGSPALWEPHLVPEIPSELLEPLEDPSVLKVAWNANFERTILARQLGINVPLPQFFDPMALSKSLGFPGKLGVAAKALEAAEKSAGTALISMFTRPSKATKPMLKRGHPETYFKDWSSHPEQWQEFCAYCKQDVISERAVWNKLSSFCGSLTPAEHMTWLLDQIINQRGVWCDLDFVQHGIEIAEAEVARLMAEMVRLTGVVNPNSPCQLGKWLRERGYPSESVDKESVAAALLIEALPDGVKKVLRLKQAAGGSAHKKLQTIIDRVGPDNRLRDQFSFCGCRTGRWSSHGVQLQNLCKPDKSVKQRMDELVESIRTDTYRPSEIPTMSVIGGLVRAGFRAAPHHHFVVGDLSQIEPHVLAWWSGCQSMIDAYARNMDLYVEFIAKVLGIDPVQVDDFLRARGKVGILGCGYQMGWEKFIEYAAGYGVTLTEVESRKIVDGFRQSYPEVVTLWNDCAGTFTAAIEDGERYRVSAQNIIIDGRRRDMARIILPSGRALRYYQPISSIETTKFGPRQTLSYQGFEDGGHRTHLYGGKIVANVTQAIARDILRDGMLAAHKIGFKIVLHAHDEVCAEVPDDSPLTLDDLLACMRATPIWAPGLIFDAKGWEGLYYRKD
jgi:DNA polymerase